MLSLILSLSLCCLSLDQPIDRIKDFTLINAVDGTPFSLSSLENSKAVVVIFTNSNCPYDKLYEKRLGSLIASYQPKNVKFVLINPNSKIDNPAEMAEKVRNLRWNVPYLIDNDHDVATMFDVQKTPEAFVLQADGRDFVVKYQGAIDDNPQVASDVSQRYLRKALDAVLKNQPVLINSTHPTGCMIK